MILYGIRYLIPLGLRSSSAASVSFTVESNSEGKGEPQRWPFRTALELWTILLFVAAMIPELIYLPQYAAPVAFPVSRLTSVTAVLGLCILGSVQPRRLAPCRPCCRAQLFFSPAVSRHRHAEQNGGASRRDDEDLALRPSRDRNHRCAAQIRGSPSSTTWSIAPALDDVSRTANYEPSSGQFRIRVRPGSPLVTDSVDSSNAMEDGRLRGPSARSPYDADRSVRRKRSDTTLHARSHRRRKERRCRLSSSPTVMRSPVPPQLWDAHRWVVGQFAPSLCVILSVAVFQAERRISRASLLLQPSG